MILNKKIAFLRSAGDNYPWTHQKQTKDEGGGGRGIKLRKDFVVYVTNLCAVETDKNSV